MTDGRHNPQCRPCVRLTRKEFNELQQTRRISSKRRGHLNDGGQPDADEPPRNRNRGSMAQDAAHPLPDVLEDHPPIEHHMQPDEDDVQDAANDDPTHDHAEHRTQHDEDDTQDDTDDPTHDHTQRTRRAGEVLSGTPPKRTAHATDDIRSDN